MLKIQIVHVENKIKEMVGQLHIKEIEQIINILFFYQIHNNYPALQNNSTLEDRFKNIYIFVNTTINCVSRITVDVWILLRSSKYEI